MEEELELSSIEVGSDSPKHVELQQCYDMLSEKIPFKEVPEIIVWEGCAKNENIQQNLSRILSDDELDDDEAAEIAKLFSCQLDSEQTMKQQFLPALKAIATCEMKTFLGVPIYMLAMLLEKFPNTGFSLFNDDLPKKDYYRIYGESVLGEFEDFSWPKCIAKMPKPNSILSQDQFHELLSQDMNSLGYKGKKSWMLLLSYSPESINIEFDDIPWSELFVEFLFTTNEGHDQIVKSRLVKTWEKATTVEKRISDMKTVITKVDHKEFEKIMEPCIESASCPLDDFEGSEEEPCLLVCCLNSQLAAKLFKHTMQTSKQSEMDVSLILQCLIKQCIDDESLVAVVKEMSRMKLFHEDDDLTRDPSLMDELALGSYLETFVELLKIEPNPYKHPFMLVLKWQDEFTCVRALEVLCPDLHALNCNVEDTNALHIAAACGYTFLVKEILVRGFHNLLNTPGLPSFPIDGNTEKLRPASIAVQATHFETAKELLQAMDSEDSKKLFAATSDSKLEIDLHKVMDEINKAQGARLDKTPRDKDKSDEIWETIQVRLEEDEVQERVEFIKTALDATVEGRNVDLTLLIQDQNGNIPDQFGSDKKQTEVDLEVGKEKSGKTFYRKIARSEYEDLISHECFATLTNIIWIDYGIVKGMLFSLYLLFMSFLTTSLALAAGSSDPSQYNNPLDRFRLFCEIITLIWVLIDFALEIYEIGRVIHKSIKQHTKYLQNTNDQNESDGENKDDKIDIEENEKDVQSVQEQHGDGAKVCLGLLKNFISEYFFDWQNMLDDSAILCVLLIIPFRIVDSDKQWIFAALAFMFHGLRIFKYAIMFRTVGEYVAILVLLIKRDVPQFLTVFLVIIFSLGGALYLALIGHYNENNFDTENNNETSEIYLLWWTGVRILAEGSALTYYGPGGFNWLGVLIYWLFLFIVVVVLLNILIAQFSKSYEEETERAQINVILTRTEIIVKMEQSVITRPCIRFVRKMRMMFSGKTFKYDKVERLGTSGENEQQKVASSEQMEDLYSWTTTLGLQLRKQIDENGGRNTTKMKEMEGRNTTKMEEMKADIVAQTSETLKYMKEDINGRLVGLERVIIDTRRYVDEIKELLVLSLKQKQEA